MAHARPGDALRAPDAVTETVTFKATPPAGDPRAPLRLRPDAGRSPTTVTVGDARSISTSVDGAGDSTGRTTDARDDADLRQENAVLAAGLQIAEARLQTLTRQVTELQGQLQRALLQSMRPSDDADAGTWVRAGR